MRTSCRARRTDENNEGSPSSFDKHQSEEELKRADPQRLKRADPQRVTTSQSQRDDEYSTETARRYSGDHSPDQQLDGETVENKISYFHRTGRERPGQDAPPRRHLHEAANDPIYDADQDELEDSRR